MSAQAELHQLRVAFKHSERLLKIIDEVTLTIRSGEIVALLGESGCGKSAMALAMMRLLPPYAYYGDASSIALNHEALLTLPEYLMREVRGRHLGMVFQEPMTALNPVLTIRTQLAEAFLVHERLSGPALEARLIEALTEVDLPDPLIKLSQYPHQLSGGQKQRVVIAMALAGHPDLLIADEPTTALDVTIQAQILELLKRLQQQRKMSVLLITHDLGVVKAVANRVCVMYAGEIVQLSCVDDFLKEVHHPYVQRLLTSVPSFAQRDALLEVMPGQVPSPGTWSTGCRFHPRCQHAFARCEHEKPALLPWGESEIRCHLYEQAYSSVSPLPLLAPKESGVSQSVVFQNEVILEARDICVSFQTNAEHFYQGKVLLRAVEGISFQVVKGKTLAIVGESGSGKTTLSRALLGLYPLSRGQIYFRQTPLCQMTRSQLRGYRKAVQMVFQDPYTSLDPRMTVADILAEGMRVQKMSASAIQIKQRLLLDQVSLPQASLTRYPHEFSGGQRQRISIARALSTDPDVLVCDEPTSALDVSVQAQILNLFKELQRDHGLAYVFITHNMSVVSYLADTVLVMKSGEMVEHGPVEHILFHSTKPYTQHLLESVL
ncbi:MAG: ABC transporter ATP-binding protein [Gammaproteobacteria bacterium]|nr:ABC transporter ATP-binding protein [Gammaproteobacteria bacterium]